MQKRETLEDFEVFYMELPQSDYMDDIVIQDAYDNASPSKIRGLSIHQVSEIARDSLDAATKQKNKPAQTDDSRTSH